MHLCVCVERGGGEMCLRVWIQDPFSERFGNVRAVDTVGGVIFSCYYFCRHVVMVAMFLRFVLVCYRTLVLGYLCSVVDFHPFPLRGYFSAIHTTPFVAVIITSSVFHHNGTTELLLSTIFTTKPISFKKKCTQQYYA